MKRFTAVFFIVMLSVMLLASCGGAGGSGGSSSGGNNSGGNNSGSGDALIVEKLGDAFAATEEDSNSSWGFDDETYVYVFENSGITYRAIADLPAGVHEQLDEIDFFDEERDAKYEKILADVEVKTFENLTERIPSQEEVNKLIGKTCGELYDEGWSYWYYNLEDMEAGMNHDIFEYSVKFEYDGPQMENTDDFDFWEEFKDLKVKEITCNGIGDATDVE